MGRGRSGEVLGVGESVAEVEVELSLVAKREQHELFGADEGAHHVLVDEVLYVTLIGVNPARAQSSR